MDKKAVIMSTITIGYFKSKEAKFMSNIVITDNFLEVLSHYAEIISITTSKKFYFHNFYSFFNLNFDYLLVDIKEFGLQQFLLREKHKVNLPFILILHTIIPWINELVYIIPLIKKEDIIIAPSEFAKRVFLKIASGINVHVIPYCFDIRDIKKACVYQDNRRDRNIVYMGRLDEEKGVGEIVACLPKIKKEVGNVHLNIIGPLSGGDITEVSKSLFYKKLETKIKRLSLGKNVSFLGLKMGKEKYRLLSQNDVFIFPTISKEETMGVSLLEAIACGLPVIATDWAANREVIKQGENGFLVSVRYKKTGDFALDKRALISLVVMILKNKKLRLQLRKKALITAKRYDYRKVIPMLLKLLRKRKRKIKLYNWPVLKKKKIVAFKRLFHKDFLFFLYYYYCSNFSSRIYASLEVKSPNLKSTHYGNKLKKTVNNEFSDASLHIRKYITRDLQLLLLGRSKTQKS